MNVLILAAGFGTRLKEFGENTPKGLIPTHEGTLIGKVLSEVNQLASSTALVTNERFVSIFRENLFPFENVQIISDGANEPQNRLGAIGDILFAVENLSWWSDDLLVVPSDTYFEFSLKEFVHFAAEKNTFTTIVRDMKDPTVIANRLGCAVIDGTKITRFVEKPVKPPSTLAAIPFYYYPQSILSLLPLYKNEGGSMDAPGSIISWLIEHKVPVTAYQVSSPTLDVGTLADIELVHSL